METFERKETKYLLTSSQYSQFIALAQPHLLPAEYPGGQLVSVYYDTDDDLLINRSIRGGKYKEKLRVRTYSDPEPGSPVFVEIKKKFKGITYKRRLTCTAEAAGAFLAGMDYEQAVERWPLADAEERQASTSRASMQVAGELAWMRHYYHELQPKMRIFTNRLSFMDADDPELRITFDADVRWTPVRTRRASASHADTNAELPATEKLATALHWVPAQNAEALTLFPEGSRVLEIKCCQAYPMWLVQALGACSILPQSVSKYGRAYQAHMDAFRTLALAAASERAAAQSAPKVSNAPATQAKRSSGILELAKSGFVARGVRRIAPSLAR